MPAAGWEPDDIGDLTGRTALVTGANVGLGLETARELAAHGALVALGCRDPERARRAADRLVGDEPGAEVEVLELDLASLASVAAAAARFDATHDRLDLLVNNAGVMGCPRALTEDGFELQLATNHLGHFALTGRLLELLLVTPGSRVVTVSSSMHHLGRIDFDDLGSERHYRRFGVYARSKLANLLFAFELARRLAAAGAGTRSMAAHPGWATSNLVASGPAMGAPAPVARAALLASHLGRPTAVGALPILFAATAPDLANGAFVGPAGVGRSTPRAARASRAARRDDDARRLFDVSEELTGVRYDLGAGTAAAA